ncbi:MAG TPA: molybdopterin cofactor-binding domain-containing protein, partial [Ktedonobacterales bacterium]|nr:molybdopterin cofactor-binding domain-containing protein [Ktedonobacterales bacterium]
LLGMLHARVVRPRGPTATLDALDASSVSAAQVVRRGNFVAVVAEEEIDAMRAARQLHVTWREATDLPPMGELHAWMRAQPVRDELVTANGDVQAALAGASVRLRATYTQPFQAHASIGPSCAVAELRNEMLTVWCSSQGIHALRGALADLLAMPRERIRVLFLEGSGCYGHNGADDVAADAAVLACELPGRPVRVQWSREDEFAWEPKGPAMLMELSAGLDAQGRISAWDYQAWSPTHARRPRRADDLVAGQLMHGVGLPDPAFFLGGDRNAPTNYALPNSRVTMHLLTRMPLRSSSLRSLGATANTFANESFMDELAELAGADPLAFRLRHLDDSRAHAVLTAATDRAGWGSALPRGEGLGLAFARYENDEAYVAMVAHVVVDDATGAVWLRRVVVAHDCGLIINPDGLRNQIEGNVIQSASRALKEEVRFDETGPTSLDWDSYPILTFAEVPEVEIVLIDRPEERAVGAGEPATITTAAAIANAIYAAVGARVREVPFTRERVRAALSARGAGTGANAD